MARPFKDMMGDTYFGRLFKVNRLIFLVVLLFFIMSIFANLIRLQTTPFFIWSMYSKRVNSGNTYHLLEIRYNDSQIINLRHTWNEPEKTILNAPLKNYLAIRANYSVDPFGTYLRFHWLIKHPGFAGVVGKLYNTSAELDEFPGWYRRWLSAQLGQPVRNICVLEKTLLFEKDGRLREISSDTTLVIR